MKKFLFLFIASLFFIELFAQATFPKLTGRVVDTANILSQTQIETLSNTLQKHEKESSNQIVIVTLNSLDGYEIADYGYQLGRFWEIGQKGKDNGVLLIISMAEKKLRIEVGYGLEGALPDKRAHEIIEYILKPQFRKGNFYKGISLATNAIIESIKGEYEASKYSVPKENEGSSFFIFFIIVAASMILRSKLRRLKNETLEKVFLSGMVGGFAGAFVVGATSSTLFAFVVFIIIAVIVFLVGKPSLDDNIYTTSHPYYSSGYNSGSSFGSGGSSFGSFGGFSGGGGSFGGGGASGGW